MCDILVVGINLNLVHVPYKVMPEFFKSVNNNKKFLVVNKVIKFGSY